MGLFVARFVKMNRKDVDIVKYKGLKRRAIRSKPGYKKPEYITPKKKVKGPTYTRSDDYKYFWGHIVTEVAKQLPAKSVICWKTEHRLSLPICALRKFVKETGYCKRCSLFQEDEYAQELRSLIETWEHDDLKEDET